MQGELNVRLSWALDESLHELPLRLHAASQHGSYRTVSEHHTDDQQLEDVNR